MTILHEKIGSELSLFAEPKFSSTWSQHLTFCKMEVLGDSARVESNSDLQFPFEIYKKILQRGSLTFPAYEVERRIIETYGKAFSIREDPELRPGAIAYSHSPELIDAYRNFTDLVDVWEGDIENVEFDREHPVNERKFFENLIAKFGDRIPHYLYQQVELDQVLELDKAKEFTGQRADFLLSFPDGQGLVLEPGDHNSPSQVELDKRRDAAFRAMGIPTLRFANAEIDDAEIYAKIAKAFENSGLTKYLNGSSARSERQLAENYLFLLPTLVARGEYLLSIFLLRRHQIEQTELSIAFYERDLHCTEWILFGFLDRVQRISELYGLGLQVPKLQIKIKSNQAYSLGDLSGLRGELQAKYDISFEDVVTPDFDGADLVIDAAIKANINTPPIVSTGNVGVLRSSYRHNSEPRFSYLSTPRAIEIDDSTPQRLEYFLRDFFRKYSLRKGQYEILENVLSQKATVGLLPTSAGKSICYQMAAILTPGTTIVVDPLVALMQDQVQGLEEQYRIDRAIAWYSGGSVNSENVGRLLARNIFIFLSPERMLRPDFRKAMRSMNAADMYVNYGVVDEAHCVSMWGHDFRPSYLNLERNFREFCTFQGKQPVLVALTGTASQLVLIDLKRELNIVDLGSIVRPDTFDRPELEFNLIQCPSDEKEMMLETVLGAIGNRLGDGKFDDSGWGIVFTHTTRNAWDLFGKYVGSAEDNVRSALTTNDPGLLRYGIYTGSAPKQSGMNSSEWTEYKRKTLRAFKRGHVRVLFGNKAVSVGIDNEYLNYIINYAMPESLEAYYQQAGRAGRNGQKSYCYLVFSDDRPGVTRKWLDGEIQEMPNRWDDLGTIGYFHKSNFPGRERDEIGAYSVFSQIVNGEPEDDGSVVVWQVDDRTERYVSYWVILGIVEDYEVTGFKQTTKYRIKRHPVIEEFLETKDMAALEEHLIGSLHGYLNRYRPISRGEVEAGVRARGDQNLSKQLIGYLIDFLYDQIVYQQRQAVRTMVDFCNESDTSPERLRARIKAYFDRSEKFSDYLDAMAEARPSYRDVIKVIDLIEGYDDVEHLYWETRRLLDERYRPDWAAISLFAVLYRERKVSQKSLQDLSDIASSLETDFGMNNEAVASFLAQYLSDLEKLDQIYGAKIALAMLTAFVIELYRSHGAKYLALVGELSVDEADRAILSLGIANQQMKELADVTRRYSRVA